MVATRARRPGRRRARRFPIRGRFHFLVAGATRYALSLQDVAAVLGYDLESQATVLPAALLDLLSSGPALNPNPATAPGRLSCRLRTR